MPGYQYTTKYRTHTFTIPLEPGIVPDGVRSSRSEHDPELRRALPGRRHQLPAARLEVVGDGAVPRERDGGA